MELFVDIVIVGMAITWIGFVLTLGYAIWSKKDKPFL